MAANMKLIVVLIIVLVASASAEDVEGKSTTTTSPTSTTTATSTATTNSTTATTTTTLSPPTPTTKLTTTTTTATTAKPTTTPASPDYWVVVDGKTGIKCILMQAKIDITYNNVSMTVPAANNGSKAYGSCDSYEHHEQWITISFSGSNLTLIFTEYDTAESKKHHRLSGLSLNETSLNINSTKFWANDKGLLSNKVYKCDAKTVLYSDGKNEVAVSNMKLEVYRNSTSTEFSKDAETCTSDNKVNNLVPIIVGACLGGLILIVLIAYLIGRKRSRHGYEQV